MALTREDVDLGIGVWRGNDSIPRAPCTHVPELLLYADYPLAIGPHFENVRGRCRDVHLGGAVIWPDLVHQQLGYRSVTVEEFNDKVELTDVCECDACRPFAQTERIDGFVATSP